MLYAATAQLYGYARNSAGRWLTLRGGLFAGTLLTFVHSLGEVGATVTVSGNLRLHAFRALAGTDLPVLVVPAEEI